MAESAQQPVDQSADFGTDLDTIDEFLDEVELPETSVSLCTKASLKAEFDILEEQLEEAREKTSGTLAGNPRVVELAQQIDALREQMRRRTRRFRFRGLPKRAWQALIDQHPPREGVDQADYNADSFPIAALSACAIKPPISPEKAGMLIDRLSQGQWNALWTAIVGLNAHEGTDIPFSPTASVVLRASPKN